MTDVKTIAQAIASQVDDQVSELREVLPYEPTAFTNAPMLSVFFSGFGRSPIESPFQEGARVVDPLGHRTWLWFFTLRLFIDLKASGEAAQVVMGDLTKKIVEAFESDATLGIGAVDSAIQSGRSGKVQPNQSGTRELLMMEMDAAVEVTEIST